MKLSKEYVIERLQNTSVHDLAVEIAEASAANIRPGVDMDATVKKFEAMLAPLAPVQPKTAADMMADMGIHVVRIS